VNKVTKGRKLNGKVHTRKLIINPKIKGGQKKKKQKKKKKTRQKEKQSSYSRPALYAPETPGRPIKRIMKWALKEGGDGERKKGKKKAEEKAPIQKNKRKPAVELLYLAPRSKSKGGKETRKKKGKTLYLKGGPGKEGERVLREGRGVKNDR